MDNYNGLNENEKGSQTSTGYYGNYPRSEERFSRNAETDL